MAQILASAWQGHGTQWQEHTSIARAWREHDTKHYNKDIEHSKGMTRVLL